MIALPILIVMMVVALPLAAVLVAAIGSVLVSLTGWIISGSRLAEEAESIILPEAAGMQLKMA